MIGRYRTAERMLTRRLQPFIGKPGQASTPVGKTLNENANLCARVVLEHLDLAEASHSVRMHEQAVVEAFPSSFLGVMLDDPRALNARRGDRSDTFFLHLAETRKLSKLVARFLPGRTLVRDPSTITNHDDRAAFACALTALCVAAGEFTAVGDSDGWIILPPPDFMKDWALDALKANAAEEQGQPVLHFENTGGGVEGET
jgi:hypothetical protein